MLSRPLAASVLGVFLLVPFATAQEQEKRPQPNPAAQAKPEKAPASQISDLEQLLLLTNGGVILLSDGGDKPASENKATDPAAAVRKALKALSGPADQLDLREVRKLLGEALSEMKQKSGSEFRVDVGGLRIAVPPLGPSAKSESRTREAELRAADLRRMIADLEKRIERTQPSSDLHRQAAKQLDEARAALDRAILETQKNAAAAGVGAAVPAQFILRFATEPASENLTLTRRNGRYVARLIEPGVRITVTGPVQADPKAPEAIIIEAGDDVSSYGNLAAVPERHRAKVARLLDLARR